MHLASSGCAPPRAAAACRRRYLRPQGPLVGAAADGEPARGDEDADDAERGEAGAERGRERELGEAKAASRPRMPRGRSEAACVGREPEVAGADRDRERGQRGRDRAEVVVERGALGARRDERGGGLEVGAGGVARGERGDELEVVGVVVAVGHVRHVPALTTPDPRSGSRGRDQGARASRRDDEPQGDQRATRRTRARSPQPASGSGPMLAAGAGSASAGPVRTRRPSSDLSALRPGRSLRLRARKAPRGARSGGTQLGGGLERSSCCCPGPQGRSSRHLRRGARPRRRGRRRGRGAARPVPSGVGEREASARRRRRAGRACRAGGARPPARG